MLHQWMCVSLLSLITPWGLLSAEAAVIRDKDPEVGPYQMIRPVSARMIHHGEPSLIEPSLYNGSGLSHRHPLFAEHGSDPDTIWDYEIDSTDYPLSIEFDLGANFLVSEMWIWQPPTENGAELGIDQFDIIMRDENGLEVGMLSNGFGQIVATSMLPRARFAAFGECIILPFPDCVRFVELRIRSNLGHPNYLSLAEVAFAGRNKKMGVPEPMSGHLALMGFILGVVRFARRGRG
ncbi:MAG: hypothetical protein GY768_04905 [Planctomycetaceae bacterium]|nr:hypothetical protein [Planctomycetaceae bacterium]